MHKRKICVVTGSRAEYGLLCWLMKEIQDDPELDLQIVATGMHMSPEFGLTYEVIEEDGFFIDEKLEMLLSSDTPVGIAKSMGLATIGFADALDRLRPDILVLLGDRYEILAAAQAALVARIPVAHLHGGESTEGAIDEAIRHSITKMAHLHFVAAEPYKKRVSQLGEDPDKIFVFGTPGLDSIKRLKLLSIDEFEKAINFELGRLNFLVTYHPVTLFNRVHHENAIKEIFKALDYFPSAKAIFTKPNSDTEGRIITRLIDEFVSRRPDKYVAFVSLGQLKYLSALKHVDVVIGNSSSGLIEVPAMKKPTINLGVRQQGRLRASSVIDCAENSESIVMAIEKALSIDFQVKLAEVVSPYGTGDASYRIKELLKRISLESILIKKFHDFSWPY